MKVLLEILPVASSALLLAMAFRGHGVPYLVWVGLVPVFVRLYRSGRLQSSLRMLLAGFFFYFLLMGWVVRLDETNPLNFLSLLLYFGVYFGMFGLASSFYLEKYPGWEALTFPSLWVALEYLRSHIGFLSFPQGILGYSQYKLLPVAGIAEYAGVYGVSFAIIAVNASLSSILWGLMSYRREKERHVRFRGMAVSCSVLAGVLLVVSGLGLRGYLLNRRAFSEREISVALIQGNAQADKRYGYDRYLVEVYPRYETMTLRAAESGAALVVWPSSSVPGVLPLDRKMVGLLTSLAIRIKAYLLIGSAGADKFNVDLAQAHRVANSAFLFSPTGAILGRYDKIRLLPFDEYLPMREFVPWPSWIVAQDMKDHAPGRRLTIFSTETVRFGVQICWENMFPDQVRKMILGGADFLVGQTNEFYLKSGDAHYQNLPYYVFRAIENRVPVIRSSTNGISCVIDGSGRIVASVKNPSGREVDIAGFVTARVPLFPERSIYSRVGDLFSWIVSATIAGLGFLGLRVGKIFESSRGEIQ